jgi:hypothetical protein
MEKTIGEQRVRTSFNVGEGETRSTIDELKVKSAELINMCDAMKDKDPRLAAMAMTAFEEAAMWAVKLATA